MEGVIHGNNLTGGIDLQLLAAVTAVAHCLMKLVIMIPSGNL